MSGGIHAELIRTHKLLITSLQYEPLYTILHELVFEIKGVNTPMVKRNLHVLLLYRAAHTRVKINLSLDTDEIIHQKL